VRLSDGEATCLGLLERTGSVSLSSVSFNESRNFQKILVHGGIVRSGWLRVPRHPCGSDNIHCVHLVCFQSFFMINDGPCFSRRRRLKRKLRRGKKGTKPSAPKGKGKSKSQSSPEQPKKATKSDYIKLPPPTPAPIIAT
jgi:hypothetical protein